MGIFWECLYLKSLAGKISKRGQILSPEQKGSFTCKVLTVFNFFVVIVLLLTMQNSGWMRNSGFTHLFLFQHISIECSSCKALFQISNSQPAILLPAPPLHPLPSGIFSNIWNHFCIFGCRRWRAIGVLLASSGQR